jgi:FAD/FMN-containing dehydrogenase
VQVTLMVKPMPEASAFVVCELPDLAAAEGLLARMIHSRALPSAIELLAGPAWQHDPALGPASQSHGARLVVGLEGSAVEVPWMIGQLQDEWRQAQVASPQVIADDRTGPLWDRLAAFAAQPAATNGSAAIVVRIQVLPGRVVPLIQTLAQLDPAASIQSHAASGVVLARLSAQSGAVALLVDQQLRPAVHSAGGHMVVLAQPHGVELSRQSAFGPEPPGFSVMQSIKNRFDPKGILNRGRFLFSPPA